MWQKPGKDKGVPLTAYSPITVLIDVLQEEIKSLLKWKEKPKILDKKQSWI